MPKASADEQAARKAAIERALHEATEVPLGVVRLSAAAIDQAGAVAAHGHRAAASDVGVAIALLRAGLRGARLNIEINVAGLSDADYTAAVATRNDSLFRRQHRAPPTEADGTTSTRRG